MVLLVEFAMQFKIWEGSKAFYCIALPRGGGTNFVRTHIACVEVKSIRPNAAAVYVLRRLAMEIKGIERKNKVRES